jgi:hypothetical protein
MRNGIVAVTFCDTVLLQSWASLAHVVGGTLLHDSLVTNLVIFPRFLQSAGGLPGDPYNLLAEVRLSCFESEHPIAIRLCTPTFCRKPEGIPFDIFTISDSRNS